MSEAKAPQRTDWRRQLPATIRGMPPIIYAADCMEWEERESVDHDTAYVHADIHEGLRLALEEIQAIANNHMHMYEGCKWTTECGEIAKRALDAATTKEGSA